MIGGNTVQHWTIEEQHKGLVVPNDWDHIQSFVTWYLSAKKPMMIPWDAEVIRTDDATAITLFRKGQYQVELYLIHPGMVIPIHAHPGVEVVTMTLGGGTVCGEPHPVHRTGVNIGRCKLTRQGQYHGGEQDTENKGGFALLAFERWLEGTPSSAALQWLGPTAGPIHDALIASHS